MGSIALGKEVTSSGLLDKMDILIRRLIDSQSEYGLVVVLTTAVLVSYTSPPYDSSDEILSVGRLDAHHPYNSERVSGPDRQERWEQSPGQPGEPTHLYLQARLFHRNGYASLGFP